MRPPTEAASLGFLTALHAAPYRCTASAIAKCALAQVSRVLHDFGPARTITHLLLRRGGSNRCGEHCCDYAGQNQERTTPAAAATIAPPPAKIAIDRTT